MNFLDLFNAATNAEASGVPVDWKRVAHKISQQAAETVGMIQAKQKHEQRSRDHGKKQADEATGERRVGTG